MSTKAKMILAQNVDLSNCDREQIQYAGAILPHGVLLSIREQDFVILQASVNTATMLGPAAEQLLGQSLAVVLNDSELRTIREQLDSGVLDTPRRAFRTLIRELQFDVFIHRVDGVIITEFEQHTGNHQDSASLYSSVHAALTDLQATETVQSFLDLAVDRVRHYTGFDRVLAYKFMEDDTGWVRSESLDPAAGFVSYKGLRYPASDIPQPARRLFAKTWLRHQPDIGYTPVPLAPQANPLTGGPLDLSCALLRSVSVMYSGYLKNMGTHSSLVMNLLRDGKLWGLLACHNHRGPLHVPYEVRVACEFMAHMVSYLMAAKERSEESAYAVGLKTFEAKFASSFSGDPKLERTLPASLNLLGFVRASGAARTGNSHVIKQGRTPSSEQILALAQWLSAHSPNDIFTTNCLSSHLPEALTYAPIASGLLAIRLSKTDHQYLLWFRPEQTQTVHWAGDPAKPVDLSDDGERLMPRTSFAIWKQTVQFTSQPWLDLERAAAADLRSSLMEILIREGERLYDLYADLERSRNELDAFAYVASHDLKEPLRGISNYAKMLNADYADRLDQEGRDRLETLIRLSRRMDNLLDSLLQYSRIGRIADTYGEVDMNAVAKDAIDSLTAQFVNKVDIRITSSLPTVIGTESRLLEVLTNLISNAAKYNDKAVKWVEIGVEPETSDKFCELYVRDNGIGILPEHNEQIFDIFRRLHGRDEFGGGAGAGLTIVKKIVEVHGGRIWVESVMNEQTTFRFTLRRAGGK